MPAALNCTSPRGVVLTSPISPLGDTTSIVLLPQEGTTHMREVTTDDLAQALDLGATVVDVREPGEYADGHVPGVVHIPMGHLTARVDELDRNQLRYVVCASGNRSAAMTNRLGSCRTTRPERLTIHG